MSQTTFPSLRNDAQVATDSGSIEIPAALESAARCIPLCGLVQRLIFRVPEYSLQRRRRIPPQGSPPTEATRFRISLALFFVQLLSQHLKELKAAGGDIVLVDEPGAVEEALRIIGDGSVHLGVDAIGGVAARKTLAVSRFLSDPFAQYLRLASCWCDFATY